MANGRIIAGVVNADGTKKSGKDFTSLKTSTGHYVVEFRPAFTYVDGGSATQIFPKDGDTRDNLVIISLDANTAEIKTGGSGGNAADRSFTFIFAGDEFASAE
jgi:hypothetical protein